MKKFMVLIVLFAGCTKQPTPLHKRSPLCECNPCYCDTCYCNTVDQQ